MAAPQRAGNWWGLLAIPGGIALVVVFGIPLAEIINRSLSDSSTSNYSTVLTSSVVQQSFFSTLTVSVTSVLACLALGYPYAYVMARCGPATALVLGGMVLVPFWLSILVRTYAWTVWLQNTGIINSYLMSSGLRQEPVELMRNSLGTTIGMSHVLLPFMILSIYAAMRRIDRRLELASRSLGAGPLRTFVRVYLPLSMPGVLAGSMIVFVTSIGFYLTPAILGDSTRPLIGQLIVQQVNGALNFGLGSAIGVVLLIVTIGLLAIGLRFARFGDVFGLRSEE